MERLKSDLDQLVKTRKNLERGKGDQEFNEGTSHHFSKKGDLDHYRGGTMLPLA